MGEKREQTQEQLEDTKFAVGAHLEVMDKPTRQDGDPPAGLHNLSPDDLDTYELPRDELTPAALYGDVDADRFFDFCGIDLDDFEASDKDDWEDLTEQIDQYGRYRQELDSREHYFLWDDEFHWGNLPGGSYGSDRAW